MRFTTDELKAILTGLNWVSDQHSVGWDRERTTAHWALVDKVCSGIRGDGLYEERPTPNLFSMQFLLNHSTPTEGGGCMIRPEHMAEYERIKACETLGLDPRQDGSVRVQQESTCGVPEAVQRYVLDTEERLNRRITELRDDEIETIDDTVGKHDSRIQRLQADSTKQMQYINNHAKSIIRLLEIMVRMGSVDAQDILNALEGK
jgi:hypothetical protein